LPIDFDANNQPVIQAKVTPVDGEPFDGRFLFDLGADLALALHSPVVRQRQLPGAHVPVVPPVGSGAGGQVTGKIGRVSELQIGSYRFDRPITLFAEDRFGSFANPVLTGNIGFQVASRFRLFLDYAHGRIIFEPTSTIGDPFDRAFSGLVIRASGKDYRSFSVAVVRDGTPAADAGFLIDDIITSVDGRPAADLTLGMINETFERADLCEVTIRRGTESLTLRLTPRKLG
jgi:PDZ domain/Aspartyl protease